MMVAVLGFNMEHLSAEWGWGLDEMGVIVGVGGISWCGLGY